MPPIPPLADAPAPATVPLVHELAESVAVYAIRLAAVATLWQDPHAIAQPLNVLPRSASPSLTKAALHQLPHIDLDFASVRLADVAMLDFMYDWSTNTADRKARPVQFLANEPSVIELAAGEKFVYSIDVASAKGLVPVVSWWFRHSPDLFFIWTEAAIDEASANGHLDVLNWWFHESGIPFDELKYSESAMDRASGNGLDHVLEWWLKSSGLRENQLKYSQKAMGLAAAGGHWTTLAWWMHSGLNLKAEYVVDYAASTDRMDVLEWCLLQPAIVQQIRFHRGQRVVGDVVEDLVTGAIIRGNRQLLDWFDAKEQLHGRWGGLQQELASVAAATKGDLASIQWLSERSWLRGSQARLVNAAAASGCIPVMQWLQDNVANGPGSHRDVIDGFKLASQGGFVDALDWLDDYGYEPSDEDSYFSYAHAGGHVAVLEWWKNYPGEFYRDGVQGEVARDLNSGSIPVLEWWLQSGLIEPEMFTEYAHYNLLRPFGKRGDLNMIRWWIELAGPACSHLIPSAVSGASYAGQMDILEYCLTHGAQLDGEDVQEAITEASKAGQIPVLEWWRTNGTASRDDFVEAFLTGVDRNRHSPTSLLWWTQVFGLDFEMLVQANSHLGSLIFPKSVLAMHIAVCQGLVPSRLAESEMTKLVSTCCMGGKVDLLMYLHRSRSDFAIDAHEALVRFASYNGHLPVLQWWKHAGLEIVPPTRAEHVKFSPSVRQWWTGTGLLEW